MATAGAVDPGLLTWAKRFLDTKAGKIVSEIIVGHCKGGAPSIVAIVPKERLDAFKDTRELCQDLQEIATEHVRNFAGKQRYEFNMLNDSGKVLATTQVSFMGDGEPTPDDVDISLRGERAMYMREHTRNYELTIGALQRQNESLERQLAKREELVDRIYAKYPELLELMEVLQDRQVERSIRLRQVGRIEDMKDKAGTMLIKYAPHLIAKLASGTPLEDESKMLTVAPHLRAIVQSLAKEPARFMEILAHMSEEERRHFMAVSEALDVEEKEEQQVLTEDPTIKVKPAAAAVPPNGAE